MKNQPLVVLASFIAAILAATTPAYARSFDQPSLTSVKVFAVAPVDDQVLAASTGGFANFHGNFSVMVRDVIDRNLSLQAGLGRIMMDNWFASEAPLPSLPATLPPAGL